MILLKTADFLRKINKWICHIGEACIAALMVIITVDVVLRMFFNSPILGAYEICQFLLLISLYGSFAFLQSEKGHVSVNILIDKFPAKVRTFIMMLTYLVAVVFTAFWTYGAFVQGMVYVASKNETALLKIPYFPFYFFEGVCMAMFTITLFIDFLTLAGALGSKQLGEVVAKWEGASTSD